MSKVLVGKQKNTPRGVFKAPQREVFVYFNSENNNSFGAGICRIPPGSNNERHAHSDADEIIYVINGEMDIEVDGEHFNLEAGDAIILLKNQIHQIFNPSKEEELLHTFTFLGTKPADAIGEGYGNSDNFTVHPATHP